MFLGIINNYSTTNGTPIPFATSINSNNKLSNTNGVISFNKTGYYNIDCELTVTNLANEISISEYANGTAKITSKVTLDATTDFDTLSICDAVKVTIASLDSKAQISIIPNVDGAIVDGTLRIEYVQ